MARLVENPLEGLVLAFDVLAELLDELLLLEHAVEPFQVHDFVLGVGHPQDEPEGLLGVVRAHEVLEVAVDAGDLLLAVYDDHAVGKAVEDVLLVAELARCEIMIRRLGDEVDFGVFLVTLLGIGLRLLEKSGASVLFGLDGLLCLLEF